MKRIFPKHPILCVGGVVIDRERVLLIKRGKEPLKGEWSIPGGMLELGEEIGDAVKRELKEETGVEIEALDCILVFDRVMRERGRVKYHYVVLDYLCRKTGGKVRPGSDVTDAKWVRREDLPKFKLTELATSVIVRAFEMTKKTS